MLRKSLAATTGTLTVPDHAPTAVEAATAKIRNGGEDVTTTHDIKHWCLQARIISEDEIFRMYHGEHIPYADRELYLSHERLRHELAGALIVISDMQKELDERAAKIARLEAELRNELNREMSS